MKSKLPMHLVPPKLREIAEYCGESVMWVIWRHYGGGHLSVPNQPPPGHPLCELLGIEQARLFCSMYGGEVIAVAKADSARRAVRNAVIKHERQEGKDLFTLARKYDLTERQIQTILKEDACPHLQFDLFNEDED